MGLAWEKTHCGQQSTGSSSGQRGSKACAGSGAGGKGRLSEPGLRPHRAQGSGGLVSCTSVEAVLALVPGSLSLGLLIYKMEPMATPGLPCSGTVL